MTDEKVRIMAIPVDVYLHVALCPCGGELRPSTLQQVTIPGAPPRHFHSCQKCGKGVEFDRDFPVQVLQKREAVEVATIGKGGPDGKEGTTVN